jgi:nicotinamidase-related amidase
MAQGDMLNFKPDPRRTALIVYDMINDFLIPGRPMESPRAREVLIPRLKPLIAACRRKGLPVIFLCQFYHPHGVGDGPKMPHSKYGCIAGTDGVEVYRDLGPEPGDIVIPKRRFDAFRGTDLELILQQQRIDTLIITGTSTSIGTETTARCAVTRDFRVIFPSDGTINRDLPDVGWGVVTLEELMRVVLTELAQFCRVCPIDTLICEIEAFQ